MRNDLKASEKEIQLMGDSVSISLAACGGKGKNSETRMTASVLKQYPNTQKIQKNAYFVGPKTQSANFRGNPLCTAFVLTKGITPKICRLCFCPNK